MNPIDHPFGDQAAALLADIADALLDGKENWQILERLRKALTTTGLDDLREVNDKLILDHISKENADLIRKAYEPKMRDMLKPDPSFVKFEGSPRTFNYTFKPESETSTVNSAMWTDTSYYRKVPKGPSGEPGVAGSST